jgi:acyl-CoA synthetase (NDP forming)
VPSPLDPLFAPRSVAVLGASRSPAKLGHRLLANVKGSGFAGSIHPVNPTGEPILGLPTVRDVEALPAGIDLALVSLPAGAVPAAVQALAGRRARSAVVLSSGFGEVDQDGRAVQGELLATARAAGLRLVGPNCMGVYSAPARLNGTYFWDLPRIDGGIGVVSQSGAYGGLIFRHLGGRGLGVARFLSIGNQADVDVADVLEYLADDPATTLIAGFVEAVRDGRRFVAAAARAAARKPVVVLKGGRSEAGRRAAGSHTGSLAGAYDVYRAACRRAGVVLAEETEEFFDAIETLAVAGARGSAGGRATAPSHSSADAPAPGPGVPGVAIVTVSGGPSVIAADCAERSGLAVPALPEHTRRALRALLPPFAAVGNPVDLTPQADPDRIAEAVRLVFARPEVGGVVAVNVGLDIPQFAEGVIAGGTATGKPIVAFTADAPGLAARFREAGIPVLPGPERAVRALRALLVAQGRGGGQAAPTPRPGPEGSAGAGHGHGWVTSAAGGRGRPADVSAALGAGSGPLPYRLARRLLEAHGVTFCREEIAATPEAAAEAAARIGYPVVLKADADGLTHRTEVGGVRLGVADADALRRACAELRAHAGAERFVVQAQVGRGVELIVGGRRDESFGPVVVVGAGGILTEVIRDVSLRLAPVDRDEARLMLREGARARLLAGPRGLPACDDAPLVAIVTAVGALMCAEPRIREIDLNPVIAAGPSAVAVDALVIVGEGT